MNASWSGCEEPTDDFLSAICMSLNLIAIFRFSMTWSPIYERSFTRLNTLEPFLELCLLRASPRLLEDNC